MIVYDVIDPIQGFILATYRTFEEAMFYCPKGFCICSRRL